MKVFARLGLSVIVMAVFFPLITHATECTSPTPPICYTTQAVVPTSGIGLLYQYTQTVTTQVQVSCAGTQKEIDYEAQELSYEACSRTSNSPTSNNLQQWANNLEACQNVAHAYLDDTIDPNGKCTCWHGYSFNAQGQCNLTPVAAVPQSSCPSNSFREFQKDGSASCITYTSDCRTKYGSNSWGDDNYCHVCSNGYEVNADATACLPVASTSTQPIATSTTKISPAPRQTPSRTRPDTIPKSATTTLDSTSSVPPQPATTSLIDQLGLNAPAAAAPPKKHWYEWLNPTSWFGWLGH